MICANRSAPFAWARASWEPKAASAPRKTPPKAPATFWMATQRLETLIRDIAEYCYEEVREPELRETDLECVLPRSEK